MTPVALFLTLVASAFFGGFLLMLGVAAGTGLSLWIGGKIVKWMEQKGLMP